MGYPGKAVRLVLGLLSIVPLTILVWVLGSALASAGAGKPVGMLADDSDAGFFLFLALCVGLGLFSMALVAYYLIFTFKSDRVKTEHQVFWAIVLLLGGPIGFPLFWFTYFWRDAEAFVRSG